MTADVSSGWRRMGAVYSADLDSFLAPSVVGKGPAPTRRRVVSRFARGSIARMAPIARASDVSVGWPQVRFIEQRSPPRHSWTAYLIFHGLMIVIRVKDGLIPATFSSTVRFKKVVALSLLDPYKFGSDLCL